MRYLSSLHSMPTSKVPAAISATTFSSLPLSLHAQVQILKTRKKPTLCKLAAKLGTEEMEAVIMVGVFRRTGAAVTVASVEDKLEFEASEGTRLVADVFISACSDQIFDLIALPGGMPGSARLRDCKILQNITTKQAQGNRLYGAICAASAVTLLPWGLLERKLRGTSSTHRLSKSRILKKLLKEQESAARFFGALYSSPAILQKQGLLKDKRTTGLSLVLSDNLNGARVVIDGNVITSKGLSCTINFALAIVSKVFGQARAKSVAEGLVFQYLR